MIDDITENKAKSRGHAIVLFSGGLDSALAVLMMLRQNIEVTALTFMTHFGCDLGDRSSCGSNPYPMAEKYKFNVKLMHLGQNFVDIVANPRWGHGKNMNPCTDCRVLMLSEAKEFMEMVNADFVVTGEVMGQRPMSQVKDKLNLTIREAGLKGKLLRPLSAKLLEPTEMELSGMVDREQLEGISGRGRHRQMAMAEEFGLEDYPSPASGCLLTDEPYSIRLRDLLAHVEQVTFDDLNMLRHGRHFRLDRDTRVIVGRSEPDNNAILANKKPGHHTLEVLGVGSPAVLLIGCCSPENIEKAAMIAGRYTTARDLPEVEVAVTNGSSDWTIKVKPAASDDVEKIAIR